MKIKEPISNSLLEFKEDGNLGFTGKIIASGFEGSNISNMETTINNLLQRVIKLETELKELKKQ